MMSYRDIRQLQKILLMRKLFVYLLVLKYLGRLIRETDPEGKIITYSYDANGNLVLKTTPDGVTTNYAYDSLNRLTDIIFPDTSQDVTYSYDSTGKVLTMTDQSGTTEYTYDDSNRLITETRTIDGISFAT
ncbi:MAG: RHS repeat protein, partial [Nitrospirae bacterium]|nr:RHS repeat protein [Nitrospirota bacterium]